jgi:hypothetical protein
VRDNFIVRNMTEADLALALELAAAEGWNPGLHDAHCSTQPTLRDSSSADKNVIATVPC